jgi:hypothetical protein
MSSKTSYGANMGSVKSAIKKGGKMAGGKRKGPAAPSMSHSAMAQGGKGMKGKC